MRKVVFFGTFCFVGLTAGLFSADTKPPCNKEYAWDKQKCTDEQPCTIHTKAACPRSAVYDVQSYFMQCSGPDDPLNKAGTLCATTNEVCAESWRCKPGRWWGCNWGERVKNAKGEPVFIYKNVKSDLSCTIP
jgi:hypothetical protein